MNTHKYVDTLHVLPVEMAELMWIPWTAIGKTCKQYVHLKDEYKQLQNLTGPVELGPYNIPTTSLQRVKTSPTSSLFMTLNNLMVRLQ